MSKGAFLIAGHLKEQLAEFASACDELDDEELRMHVAMVGFHLTRAGDRLVELRRTTPLKAVK